jgi:hypothetical protein
MLPLSLLFVLALLLIGYLVSTLALIAPFPFSPIIFPTTFILTVLAAIYFAPTVRAWLDLPAAPPASNPRNWIRNNLLYLALAPILLLLLFLPSLQIGYHGLFHSGYVYDILLRGLPPENVTLPGYPANDYWPYHVYLALIVTLFQVPPPFASALSNILLLGLSCLWVAAIWKRLQQDSAPAFYVLFPLLGANLFFFLNALLPPSFAPDLRLDISLTRFVNFNGFSVGILFFLVALFLALRVLANGLTLRDFYLLVALGGGALLFHATTGLYLFAVLAPTLLLTLLPARKRLFPSTLSGRALLEWILLPALFLLPPALFLLRAADAMAVKTTFEFFNATDLASILVMTYPLAIFFFPAATRAWKTRDLPILFLSLLALWGFVLAFFLKLPDGNEYKFIYLSSAAYVLVAMTRVKEIVSQPGTWRKALVIFLGLALVYNIGYGTWAFYDMYSHRHQSEITYQGIHVTLAQDDFAPFVWIREHAPADTVVVAPFTSKDWNYEYFSERLPYVVAGHIYNEGLPETRARRLQLEGLYDPARPVAERMEILRDIVANIGRPVALVYPADKEFNAAIAKAFPSRAERVGNFVVYLLNLP